jgi:hypothetical protein
MWIHIDHRHVDVLHLPLARQGIQEDQEDLRVVDPPPGGTHPSYWDTQDFLLPLPSHSQKVTQHQVYAPSQFAATDAPLALQTTLEKPALHLHLQALYSDDFSPILC